MKKLVLTSVIMFGILLPAMSQNNISVTDRYKYYDGNKVGRLVEISSGDKISNVKVNDKDLNTVKVTGTKTEVILPENIGVKNNDTIKMQLFSGNKLIKEEFVAVTKMRHWNILMFPHAHVDIGYTHTHEIVEFIHRQNIDQAIELCEKTKDYPEDARFVWNTEVSWAVEKYLAKASAEKRKRLIDAIKKGYISVDAAYVNTNTSAAHEPELLELYSTARKVSDLTGVKSETMVMVDIPGISWGIPAIAAITGVKNFISLPNGGDRVGRASDLNYHPRFWTGPDGKSKLFFIQPGPYADAGLAKRNDFFFKNLGLEDSTKLPKVTKTDNPRKNFIDGYIKWQLPIVEADTNYVLDIFPMAWCQSDNVPIDADLPDAVKSWNEEYAYPHLKICSSKDIIAAYRKYEDMYPTVSGDYTEYWTDGLGTSAEHTGHHREVKETLMQAEIISCITGNTLPASEITDAWSNSIMGTEHTWAYIWPDKYPTDKILNVKYGYFNANDSLTKDLLRKALPQPVAQSNTIAVFNTESFVRGGLVTIPVNSGVNCVIDAVTGKEINSQLLSDGRLAFMASDIPALSSKNYILKSNSSIKKIDSPDKTNIIDNDITTIIVDQYSGDIVSMKIDNKEYINQKIGVNGNTYRYLKGNSSLTFATKAYDVELKWKEYGPVVKTLSVISKAEGCNSLTREITLLEGEKFVRINNIVDKIATKNKEGIHFGFSFDIDKPIYHADVPWGYMQIDKDQWPEGNRNWMAAQRWVNMSDSTSNITICSLNSPLFEIGELTANILGSGSRHSWLEHTYNLPTIWFWVLNNHWHTNFRLFQDGKLSFKYVINPSNKPLDIADVDKFAMTQSRNLISCPVSENYSSKSPFELDIDKSIEVSCIRPINQGKSMLVFLHSFSCKDQPASFKLQKGSKSYQSDAYGKIIGDKTTSFTIPAKGITVVRIDK